MGATELHAVRDRLTDEIAKIEKNLRIKREQLTHIEQAMRLEPGFSASAIEPRRGQGRKSLAQLPYDRLVFEGHEFTSPGQLLDHFDEPHYFSRIHPGKKDAAAREILRWAKRNPHLAAAVTVVMRDGSSISLVEAVSRL